MERQGVVVSVNVSEKKGVQKRPLERCQVLADHGLEGDAHAGPWHRQVSLLAEESIKKMQALGFDVGPGDFAENITTRGLDLLSLPVGTRLIIDGTVLEITQHGKTCHTKCAIYHRLRECIMPTEGIFAKVLQGGEIRVGDEIKVLRSAAPKGGEVGMRVAVLTISDKGFRGEREDLSGKIIVEKIVSLGAEVIHQEIIPDEADIIAQRLIYLADEVDADLVLTTGGTGLSPRDVTPEATKAVIDREAPGFVEAMRYESLKNTPHAMLSRAVSGVRKQTLIINLPGSPKAVEECLSIIVPALPHGIEILRGRGGECAHAR